MQLPPLQAARTAATEVVDGVRAVVSGLGEVAASLTGSPKAEKSAEFQGPLGIARMGAQIASSDASRLLDFVSVLSLNLAVFNTLPLPGTCPSPNPSPSRNPSPSPSPNPNPNPSPAHRGGGGLLLRVVAPRRCRHQPRGEGRRLGVGLRWG